MKATLLSTAFLSAATAALSTTALAQSQNVLQLWRDYAGVTWSEAVRGAPDAASVNLPIAGVHTTRDGRYFVSNPRVLVANSPATLSIIDTSAAQGPARLKAFPSRAANDPAATPEQALRSVLGFAVDERNQWVWVLDMGYVGGESEAPVGGQKIMIFDLKSGGLVKRIPLDGVADRKGSFLNDIVVDEAQRIAYVSDSAVRGGNAGLIVVNYDTGGVRRVLDGDASVEPEAGMTVVSHGLEVLPGHPLHPGVNGIALSPDRATLYWTVTSGRRAHAIETRLLRDPKLDPATLSAHVEDLGDVGGASDGIATDAAGDVYITDLTRNGVVRYDHGAKTMTLIASDDRIHWPDTLTVLPNGDLLFAASALNEHFMGAIKAGDERNQLWLIHPAHN